MFALADGVDSETPVLGTPNLHHFGTCTIEMQGCHETPGGRTQRV
jgi:hypothetical protein